MRVTTHARMVLCGAALIALSASGSGAEDRKPNQGVGLRIESAAFQHNGEIPTRYTCQGKDVSPPLSWVGFPETTASLALIVDDPDAPDPDAPKMTWVHWVVFNIPAEAAGFAEAVKQLPVGTAEGLNSWTRTGYGGPCPPIGRHRYFHKLYALDSTLDLQRPTKAELEKAMEGHILARAELIGTYEKKK